MQKRKSQMVTLPAATREAEEREPRNEVAIFAPFVKKCRTNLLSTLTLDLEYGLILGK